MIFIPFVVMLFLLVSFIPGIPIESTQTRPQDFEQAKIDCATQEGVKSISTTKISWKPNRVEVTCNNGIMITRSETK